MKAWKVAFASFLGFGSGVVIAGAVFAFIAIIGIVPRLAQKTKTQKHIMLYEEAIIIGGIFGTLTMAFDFNIPTPGVVVMFFALCTGVFNGCLAVSLAEVLDVIPILTRRARIQKGMYYFILSIAAGKLVGALVYFIVPGFFKLD